MKQLKEADPVAQCRREYTQWLEVLCKPFGYNYFTDLTPDEQDALIALKVTGMGADYYLREVLGETDCWQTINDHLIQSNDGYDKLMLQDGISGHIKRYIGKAIQKDIEKSFDRVGLSW